MKIAENHLFQPGNVHTRRRAIQVLIDGSAGVAVPRSAIQELEKGFQRIRPISREYPAWRRLIKARSDVPAAAVVEVVAVMLQRYCHWPVKFCSWRESATRNHDATARQADRGIALYETMSENVGLAAGGSALVLTQAMLDGMKAADLFELFIEQITEFLGRTGAETPPGDGLRIASAAVARGIPWSVVHQSRYIRMGMGKTSHVMRGTESTNTRSIARELARNKGMTHRLLDNAGLPVAKHLTTSSKSKAEKFAAEIGYPVVVKPRDGNMGRAVSVGISDKAGLRRAFDAAQAVSRSVVVESQIEGLEYRMLVIDGKMVGTMHRQAGQVMADGNSTVRQLVSRENMRPERERALPTSMAILRPLRLDSNAIDVLAEQGLDPDSVPSKGTRVFLRRESNISRGGEGIDMTDRMHPENVKMAVQAAEVIGLDVCGVDFITPDPSVPWQENRGAICELNSRPGVNMQIYSMRERGHRIPDAILDMLFPEGTANRMPVLALVGTSSQRQKARETLEAAFATSDAILGIIPADDDADPRPGAGHTRILKDISALEWDNEVDATIIEVTPEQVASRGVGVERVDMAIIAPSEDVSAQGGTLTALRRIAGNRVMDIDDPLALKQAAGMLGLSEARVDETSSEPSEHDRPVTRKPPRRNEFTALFVGDVGFGESYMHHPRVSDLQRILATHGHGYSLKKLRGILEQSDLTIANLEVPLCARPDAGLQGRKKYLGWSDPARTTAALHKAGIDAVTLANNHMLDCGMAGLSETFLRLQQAGITAFGAGPDAQIAGHPFVHRFKVGGKERSLVVFAGFEYRRRYDRSYHWYARGGNGGIAQISPEQIGQTIAKLRDTLPDPTFIAFPHWGTDYETVTDAQRQGARELIAAGVELIIGHGTHVTQPATLIEGRPVLFNIGNFIWNTPGRFNKRDVLPVGLAVSLHFDKSDAAPRTLRAYPILIDNDQTAFQNRPVTEDELAAAKTLLEEELPMDLASDKDDFGWYLEMDLAAIRADSAHSDRVAAE